MPRTARASVGDVCYHVLNRGNGRMRTFHEADDYSAFVDRVGTARRLGLEFTLHPLGRPRKEAKK